MPSLDTGALSPITSRNLLFCALQGACRTLQNQDLANTEDFLLNASGKRALLFFRHWLYKNKKNYLTVHATSGYWCTFANYLWKPIVLCIAVGMQKSADSGFGKPRIFS
jgi:hypothetical protein